MLCPLLQLAEGEISASTCKELISKELIAYTTDFSFYQDFSVKKRAKRIQFLHEHLMNLINELDKE